jgi:hypothetical protein
MRSNNNRNGKCLERKEVTIKQVLEHVLLTAIPYSTEDDRKKYLQYIAKAIRENCK